MKITKFIIFSTLFLIFSLFMLIVVGKAILKVEQKVQYFNYCEVDSKLDVHFDDITQEYIIEIVQEDVKIPKYLYVLWGLSLISALFFVRNYGDYIEKEVKK